MPPVPGTFHLSIKRGRGACVSLYIRWGDNKNKVSSLMTSKFTYCVTSKLYQLNI